MFQPRAQRHCGRCSQCIDRRFAITAAGLTAYDPETDYVSDVFTGPRPKALERTIAADYTRHGIELDRRTENELAAVFNAELSRAARHESKRSEAARKFISMHKRHGEGVVRVLKHKVAENADKLIRGALERTSLLALSIGQDYFPQECVSLDKGTIEKPTQYEADMLASIDRKVEALYSKFAGTAPRRIKKKKKRPKPRDTVIFAAILKGYKGMKYCSYLDAHRIRPKWYEVGPRTYLDGYRAGNPWRKKIQDEKSRTNVRMKSYELSELADAINAHLPKEFDEIIPLLHSRNSRSASKTAIT